MITDEELAELEALAVDAHRWFSCENRLVSSLDDLPPDGTRFVMVSHPEDAEFIVAASRHMSSIIVELRRLQSVLVYSTQASVTLDLLKENVRLRDENERLRRRVRSCVAYFECKATAPDNEWVRTPEWARALWREAGHHVAAILSDEP